MDSILNILSWLIFGAIAGWVASMIAGENAQQGWVGNVIVGIIGAFIGGIIFSFIGLGGNVTGPWNITSFIAAVVGAVILLLILRAVQGRA